MRCVVFRCAKKSEMYLYLPYAEEDLDVLVEQLDEDLKKITGRLTKVMELKLSPKKKLARVDVGEVISALQKKGFYLQSPPHEILRKDVSMLHNPSDTF